MGFDINVNMVLHMCPKTGKPFYYKFNQEKRITEKCYELPSIVVPAKMCEYLVGRGHIFQAYTEYFNDREMYDVSVEDFLEQYPSWDEVLEHSSYDDEYGWIEEDHEGFKRLLEWCTRQGICFRVSWSY